jgi:hypothetical protein
MLWSKHQVNWAKFPDGNKRGRVTMHVREEGWVTLAALTFQAAPDTELARLIPPLPSLSS